MNACGPRNGGSPLPEATGCCVREVSDDKVIEKAVSLLGSGYVAVLLTNLDKKEFPGYEKVADYAFVTLEFLGKHAFVDRAAIDEPSQATYTVLEKNSLDETCRALGMDQAIYWVKVRKDDPITEPRIFIVRHLNTKIEMI